MVYFSSTSPKSLRLFLVLFLSLQSFGLSVEAMVLRNPELRRRSIPGIIIPFTPPRKILDLQATNIPRTSGEDPTASFSPFPSQNQSPVADTPKDAILKTNSAESGTRAPKDTVKNSSTPAVTSNSSQINSRSNSSQNNTGDSERWNASNASFDIQKNAKLFNSSEYYPYTEEMGLFALGNNQPPKIPCKSICVRREISLLSQDELNSFFGVLKQLNTPGPNGSLSWFAELVNIHVTMASYIHGNDYFLHWHRYFLLILERKIQSFLPNFCMPYWDWPNMSQNFTKSVIFSSSMFGWQDSNGCISGGPFTNFTVFPNQGCVTRNLNTTFTLSSFGVIVAMTKDTHNFTAFSTALEVTPHSGPHLAIGGSMSTMASPADPVFWLHHSTVDKLWSDLTYNTSGHLKHPRLDDVLPGLNFTVRDLDHAEDWCYSYSATPKVAETVVKPPTPINSDFLAMNQQLKPAEASRLADQLRQKAIAATEKFSKNPQKFNNVPVRSDKKNVTYTSSGSFSKPNIGVLFMVSIGAMIIAAPW